MIKFKASPLPSSNDDGLDLSSLLEQNFKDFKDIKEDIDRDLKLLRIIYGSSNDLFLDFFRHSIAKIRVFCDIRGLDGTKRKEQISAFANEVFRFFCKAQTLHNECIKIINYYVDTLVIDQKNDVPECPFKKGNGIDLHGLYRFCIRAFNLCKFEDSDMPAIWTGKSYEESLGAIKHIITELLRAYCFYYSDRWLKEKITIFKNPSNTVKHAPYNFIPFQNCTLEIINPLAPFEDGKAYRLHMPSRDIYVTRALAVDFNPNAYDETLDHAFNDWALHKNSKTSVESVDPDLRANYEEVVGYVLLMTHTFKGMPLLYGTKNCGKSTFLEMLGYLVGSENCYPTTLRQLAQRFNLHNLIKPRVFIGDDQAGGALEQELQALIKNTTSESKVQVEQKGIDPIKTMLRGVGIFSTNVLPDVSDETCRARFLIVPFLHAFKTSAKDADKLKSKISDLKALEYVALLGVRGAMRMMSRKGNKFADHFTHCDVVDDATKEFNSDCDTITQWLESFLINENDFTPLLIHREYTLEQRYSRTISSFYDLYKDFCKENDLQHERLSKFKKTIPEKYTDQRIKVDAVKVVKPSGSSFRADVWLIRGDPQYDINRDYKKPVN